MRILGFGGNQLAAAGGYNVDNSLRFNDGSTDYLNHTHNAVTSTRKQTFSVWVKRSHLTSYMYIISTKNGTGTNRDGIAFSGSDQIDIRYNAGATSPIRLTTNRVFRDVSAWYHIVVAVDTTQGTASNRIKLYVNGVQETSFATSDYMDQDYDFALNAKTDQVTGIGVDGRIDGSSLFDGYMSEFVAIDNQQLDATSFGEFDEDTGIWKPIDVSGLTFGSAGFYLPFENSGALGQDDSGNGNNFTVNNLTSIDQTTDTPTNNFCTLNAIVEGQSNVTYSEGNLKASESAGDLPSAKGTIAVSSGKWYWEGLLLGGNGAIAIGTDDMDASSYPHNSSTSGDGWTYHYDGSGRTSTGSNITIGSTYTTNDIIGVALDMDSGTCKFYKNGTEQTTGSWSGLNAYGSILPAFYLDSITWFANFGQEGSFGGNVTAQGNADGNGFGDFYYAPPSGYYALNTKNLAEYG